MYPTTPLFHVMAPGGPSIVIAMLLAVVLSGCMGAPDGMDESVPLSGFRLVGRAPMGFLDLSEGVLTLSLDGEGVFPHPQDAREVATVVVKVSSDAVDDPRWVHLDASSLEPLGWSTDKMHHAFGAHIGDLLRSGPLLALRFAGAALSPTEPTPYTLWGMTGTAEVHDDETVRLRFPMTPYGKTGPADDPEQAMGLDIRRAPGSLFPTSIVAYGMEDGAQEKVGDVWVTEGLETGPSVAWTGDLDTTWFDELPPTGATAWSGWPKTSDTFPMGIHTSIENARDKDADVAAWLDDHPEAFLATGWFDRQFFAPSVGASVKYLWDLTFLGDQSRLSFRVAYYATGPDVATVDPTWEVTDVTVSTTDVPAPAMDPRPALLPADEVLTGCIQGFDESFTLEVQDVGGRVTTLLGERPIAPSLWATCQSSHSHVRMDLFSGVRFLRADR